MLFPQETIRSVLHSQDSTLQSRLTAETEMLRTVLTKRIDSQATEISRIRDHTASVDKQLDRVTELLEKLAARIAAVEYEVGLAPPASSRSAAASGRRSAPRTPVGGSGASPWSPAGSGTLAGSRHRA